MRKIKNNYVATLIIIFISVNYSCVETFDFESEVGITESALVVEATITNEEKHQEILLSRVFKINEDAPIPERNAEVKIIDNTNAEYLFIELDSSGNYLSIVPFKAKKDNNYVLQIITNDGKEYNSLPTKFTQATEIDSLYASRDFNDLGEEGVSVFVNSFDTTGNSKYYRYEYEETYKIKAPLYQSHILTVECPPPPPIVLPGEDFEDFQPPIVELIPREEQVQLCYRTVKSNTIINTNTISLSEDKVNRFPIRFINSSNYSLLYRYSIQVRQYVQSREAYVYYETLKEFSEAESLFSENQSGFIEGNIFSKDIKDDKVIGYFEVSSIDEKRIYFNHTDFSLNIMPSPYAVICDDFFEPLFSIGKPHDEVAFISPLKEAILAGQLFYDFKDPEWTGPAIPAAGYGDYTPYILVSNKCGDCTNFGKTEVPDFWVD